MIDRHTLHIIEQCGILDSEGVRKQIEMHEKQYYLKQHIYKIWEGKNGYWYSYLPDQSKLNGRRMIKKRRKEDIESEIVKHIKEYGYDPTIKEVFEEWTKQKLDYGEIKKQTYDRYELDYIRFIQGSDLEKVPFRHITEDDLEDFIRRSIHDKDLTAKAWGNLRTILYGIFKYGKKKGYSVIGISGFMGDLELSKNIFKKRCFTSEESVFNSDEIRMIKEYIKEAPFSMINMGILLGFETGLRIGELSALKIKDVDIKNDILIVRRKEVRYKNDEGRYIFDIEDRTKGSIGFRKVILTDEAKRIIHEIRKYNPFGEYLFQNVTEGNRINGTYFTVKLRSICRHLGIKERSMHKARKTYGTKLFNANLNERLIMSQMGHTRIATTKEHYYFDDSTTAEAKEAIRNAIGM